MFLIVYWEVAGVETGREISGKMSGSNELSKLPAPNEIVILSGNSHLDLAHKIAA